MSLVRIRLNQQFWSYSLTLLCTSRVTVQSTVLFKTMSIFQRIVYRECMHLDVQAVPCDRGPPRTSLVKLPGKACIPAQRGVSLPDSHKSTMWASDGPHRMKIESNSFPPKDCFRYFCSVQWVPPTLSFPVTSFSPFLVLTKKAFT